MNALLLGPLALAFRYLLTLLAGALAGANLAVWDAATGTLTLRVDDAAPVLASAALFAAVLVWRKLAVRFGGKT